METLTIGRLAERAGVGVETIRFYERERLIPEPARTHAGYRQYDEKTVARLHFIRRGKELGFSLAEIRDLLNMHADASLDCGGVRERAERKLASIDAKIRDLQRMRANLADLRDACHGNRPTSECSILDALACDPCTTTGGET
jgi:MerR family transcriptional regulator, copper efflux regulator